MKKKNIISLAGVVALLMGLGLNLEYALDDYGLKSNSLNLFVLAQASNSGGVLTFGDQVSVTAHCPVSPPATTSSGGSSSVSGGTSGATGNVNGSGSSGTTVTKLYCLPSGKPEADCVYFDPC